MVTSIRSRGKASRRKRHELENLLFSSGTLSVHERKLIISRTLDFA